MIVVEKIRFNEDHLLVELSGDYVLEAAKNNFIDVIEICIKYQISKLLVDATRINNKISVLESREYGFFLSKFKKLQLKVAFLSLEENIHEGKPLQASAVQNGFNIRVMSDHEKALRWLLEEQS